MLNFDSQWRFESPGVISSDVIDDVLSKVIGRVATNSPRQTVLETFKRRFSHALGRTSSRSSNEGWAESDLTQLMHDAAENAALFIEALYDGLNDMNQHDPHAVIPPWPHINKVLVSSGYALQPN